MIFESYKLEQLKGDTSYMKKASMILLLGGMVMLLFGCGKKLYKVDYCGAQSVYENAKESYREGERVVLKYGLIATDTNYSFYLDDEPIDYNYKDGAYLLSFVMPGHDVKIECRTSNSMVATNIAVTIQNQVKAADIWIIPDTEANRKTTVWGTAVLSKLDVGTSQTAYVWGSPEDNGMYLIRMIDEDQMFYSADGIKLEHNQSIVIHEDKENRTIILEVYDADGIKIAEYEMFAARL